MTIRTSPPQFLPLQVVGEQEKIKLTALLAVGHRTSLKISATLKRHKTRAKRKLQVRVQKHRKSRLNISVVKYKFIIILVSLSSCQLIIICAFNCRH